MQHGETNMNVQGRIGGDDSLSPRGQQVVSDEEQIYFIQCNEDKIKLTDLNSVNIRLQNSTV